MEVKALLNQYAVQEATKLQEGLFVQKKRLADAERVLAGSKPTKKASEDQRIATNKIEQALARLADLQRSEPKERARASSRRPGRWTRKVSSFRRSSRSAPARPFATTGSKERAETRTMSDLNEMGLTDEMAEECIELIQDISGVVLTKAQLAAAAAKGYKVADPA